MTDSTYTRPIPPSDEIDLVELLRTLWAEKLLIALITFAVTALAAAYAFLVTPQYKVQSVMRAVRTDQLGQLNRTRLVNLTGDDALKRVGAALESHENRLAFSRAHQPDFGDAFKDSPNPEQAFGAFSDKAFELNLPDPKKNNFSPFVGIGLTYPKGMDGVKILNNFVEYSHQGEKEKIIADIKAAIANRLVQLDWQIRGARAGYQSTKTSRIAKLEEGDNLKRAQLEDELRALRLQLKEKRQNRIKLLNESITIASALGIEKPTNPTALGESARQSSSTGTVVRAEVSNQTIPLYFMGTEALRAEREALLKRTTDDFTEPRIDEIGKELRLLAHNREIETIKSRKDEDRFLDDLSKWEEESERLKAINITTDQFSLVQIDEVAIQPRSPVWPKKKIIIGSAIFIGFMLGVLTALIKRAFFLL